MFLWMNVFTLSVRLACDSQRHENSFWELIYFIIRQLVSRHNVNRNQPLNIAN